jgi:hypothetical protein
MHKRVGILKSATTVRFDVRVSASRRSTLWVAPATAGLRHKALTTPPVDVIHDCRELERAIEAYGLAAGRIIPERAASGIRIVATAIASRMMVGIATWRRSGQQTGNELVLACGCDKTNRAGDSVCLAFAERIRPASWSMDDERCPEDGMDSDDGLLTVPLLTA